MSLTPQFLEEIRNRLTLSEIIGRRVKVTRAGRESKACCPFHHEKTPSFTINDDKQFYHCFGCGAHGDVIRFVMQYDNLAFRDAVELLAAEAGLQVPKITPAEAKKAEKQKDLYGLMEEATLFFQAQIWQATNADALQYLRGRGLSDQTISEFRLGFAPNDGQVIRKVLLAKGFTDKDMIDCGLLKPSSKGAEPYAFFRDRIIFPVPDRRGRVVAFGGRVLPEHLRPPQRGDFTPPKYINSSETPLFHKGSMLYGEPTARRAAADGQNLIVVEGYLDVISCAQAGLTGALAPMGTALTEEQITAMWKMIPGESKVPILCFDGDNAGRKAALRVIDRILPILKPGCSVNFVFLPNGEDPDSLIKSSGIMALRGILERPLSLFDFLWNSHIAGRNLQTPESRAGVIKALEEDVTRINDKNVQTHYRAALRRRIGEVFFPRTPAPSYQAGSYRSYGAKQARASTSTGTLLQRPSSQGKIFPRVLLAAVINHPQIYEGIEEQFGAMQFEISTLEGVKRMLVSILATNPDITRQDLVENLKNSGLDQVIDDILNESVYVHASFCAPGANTEGVQRLWLAYWKDGHTSGLEQEIQKGWKQAYQNADQAEEERLRSLVSAKSAGEEG